MRILLFFALVSAALPAQDSADAEWQLTLRLSQVKRHIRDAMASQPDYTCLATFDRYHWPVNERTERKIDTVRVEVAYLGGKELYSWPGEGKFSDASLSSIVGMGMMGDGDFAVHAHNLFVADGGVVTYAGEEQDHGRQLWRWKYKISVYQSGWTVQQPGRMQKVGSEGSFWVDAKTLDLVRMDNHATDFLEGFPLQAVVSTVEYGRLRIGDQDVLMPVRAELKTTESKGDESRNVSEYSNCRQYAGQSTISFGALPDVPAAPAPPKPGVVESSLPARLTLQIRLSKDLDLTRAVVGDQIEGTLTAAVRDDKKELAPKGAIVRGRVRLLNRDPAPSLFPGSPDTFRELGLVFDELEFKGHLDHFTAQLKSFDTPLPGVRLNMLRDGKETIETAPGYTRTTTIRSELAPANLPGASVFFVDTRNASLPKGTLMTWTTQ